MFVNGQCCGKKLISCPFNTYKHCNSDRTSTKLAAVKICLWIFKSSSKTETSFAFSTFLTAHHDWANWNKINGISLPNDYQFNALMSLLYFNNLFCIQLFKINFSWFFDLKMNEIYFVFLSFKVLVSFSSRHNENWEHWC